MLFPHNVNMLKSYLSNCRKLIRADRVYRQTAEMSCIRGTGEGMQGIANKIPSLPMQIACKQSENDDMQ